MPSTAWSIFALALLAVALLVFRAAARRAATRETVLQEVRRSLQHGVIETLPGRGLQARGRLGDLEVTVDLGHDRARRSQSPMWRVLAIGPVSVDHPVELRVDGWQGWIDPWMQFAESVRMDQGPGHDLTAHSEQPICSDHPIVLALKRQGALGPGALHVRPDLMRAEVKFRSRARENRTLFAYLNAMREISQPKQTSQSRPAARAPRVIRLERVSGSAS